MGITVHPDTGEWREAGPHYQFVPYIPAEQIPPAPPWWPAGGPPSRAPSRPVTRGTSLAPSASGAAASSSASGSASGVIPAWRKENRQRGASQHRGPQQDPHRGRQRSVGAERAWRASEASSSKRPRDPPAEAQRATSKAFASASSSAAAAPFPTPPLPPPAVPPWERHSVQSGPHQTNYAQPPSGGSSSSKGPRAFEIDPSTLRNLKAYQAGFNSQQPQGGAAAAPFEPPLRGIPKGAAPKKAQLSARAVADQGRPVDAVGQPIRLRPSQVGTAEEPASWGLPPSHQPPPYISLAAVTGGEAGEFKELQHYRQRIIQRRRCIGAFDCHGVVDDHPRPQFDSDADFVRVDRGWERPGFAADAQDPRWDGISSEFSSILRSAAWNEQTPLVPLIISFVGDPVEQERLRPGEGGAKSTATQTLVRRTADALGRWMGLGGFYELPSPSPFTATRTPTGESILAAVERGLPLILSTRRKGNEGKAVQLLAIGIYILVEDTFTTCTDAAKKGVLPHWINSRPAHKPPPTPHAYSLEWCEAGRRNDEYLLHPRHWRHDHMSVREALIHVWSDLSSGLIVTKLTRLRRCLNLTPATPFALAPQL